MWGWTQPFYFPSRMMSHEVIKALSEPGAKMDACSYVHSNPVITNPDQLNARL